MNNSPTGAAKDKSIDGLTLDSLPFVLGVVSNLAGHASSNPTAMERITKANFDHYFASVAPTLHLTCFPFIPDEYHRVDIQIAFKSMADFEVSKLRLQLLPKWETSIEFMNALIDAIMHDSNFMQL